MIRSTAAAAALLVALAAPVHAATSCSAPLPKGAGGVVKSKDGILKFNVRSSGKTQWCAGPVRGLYVPGSLSGKRFVSYAGDYKDLKSKHQTAPDQARRDWIAGQMKLVAAKYRAGLKTCNAAGAVRKPQCGIGPSAGGVKPKPTPAPTGNGGKVIFGVNDGTGYDDSREFSIRVSDVISKLGLTAVRTGADTMGCEREGQPCDFSRRDVVIKEHLARGVKLHMVVAFRWELDVAGYNTDQWARNYAWKCGQLAKHWKDTVRYYIVDNEADIPGRDAARGAEPPENVVRMQKACYEAIKAVDKGILVESSPATRPNTEFNRRLLELGIGKYADIIGTHMYGGQLREDAVSTLYGWMREFGVNKPVGISECGSDPNWFNPGGGDGNWKGLHGQEARARWLRDMAVYARDKKLHNVLFFSMFSIHGPWEMHEDRHALKALDDIGHGRF